MREITEEYMSNVSIDLTLCVKVISYKSGHVIFLIPYRLQTDNISSNHVSTLFVFYHLVHNKLFAKY